METGGFQRLAKLMFKFLRKYEDKELVVRVAESKGVRFEKFLKEDFPDDWDRAFSSMPQPRPSRPRPPTSRARCSPSTPSCPSST